MIIAATDDKDSIRACLGQDDRDTEHLPDVTPPNATKQEVYATDIYMSNLIDKGW